MKAYPIMLNICTVVRLVLNSNFFALCVTLFLIFGLIGKWFKKIKNANFPLVLFSGQFLYQGLPHKAKWMKIFILGCAISDHKMTAIVVRISNLCSCQVRVISPQVEFLVAHKF
jgi:hypothetical protein